jgi:hypothetical protein
MMSLKTCTSCQIKLDDNAKDDETAGLVACMGENGNTYRILVGKPEEKDN